MEPTQQQEVSSEPPAMEESKLEQADGLPPHGDNSADASKRQKSRVSSSRFSLSHNRS